MGADLFTYDMEYCINNNRVIIYDSYAATLLGIEQQGLKRMIAEGFSVKTEPLYHV